MVATGVEPRTPPIPGIDHPKVLSYIDVLRHKRDVGKDVAIIGAGGIGFDVAEYLVHSGEMDLKADAVDVGGYMEEWGVDMTNEARSGLQDKKVGSLSGAVHIYIHT